MNLIGGQWRAGRGEMLESVNPANPKEVVASFPQCSPADVDDAVSAAVTAQPSWEALGIIKRGSILREVADLMTIRREELAALMTQEQGKTLPEAKIKLRTPAGTPASWNSFANAWLIAGMSLAGFQTTVFPHNKAGAIFQAGI